MLVFFNLHIVHDYYQAALTPIAAAIAGVGASALFRHPEARPVPAPSGGRPPSSGCSSPSASPTTTTTGSGRGATPRRATLRLATARSIEAHTLPGERVAVVGFDWSPEVLYYARRKGIMFTDGITTATTLAAIDGSYRLLAVSPPVPVGAARGGARPLASPSARSSRASTAWHGPKS